MVHLLTSQLWLARAQSLQLQVRLFLTLLQHDARGVGEGDNEVPIGFGALRQQGAPKLRRVSRRISIETDARFKFCLLAVRK